MPSPLLLLDASTSTAATSGAELEVGLWKIFAEIVAADGATVALEESDPASTIWRDVVKDGVAVTLSEAEPSVIVFSSQEKYRVTRSGGSAAVTVRAKHLRH